MNNKQNIFSKKRLYIGQTKERENVYINTEINLQTRDSKKTVDLIPVSEYKTLSFNADIYIGRNFTQGGQSQATIRRMLENDEFLTMKIPRENLVRILDIWDEWHLNDLNAGTNQQMAEVKKFREENNITAYAYEFEKNHLESIGLLEDAGYKYGHGWLVRLLPDEIIEEVKSLFGEGNK